MSVIPDHTIREMVQEKNQLSIEPFYEDALQPASYDLRLGPKLVVGPDCQRKAARVDLRKEEGTQYILSVGQFVDALPEEKLKLGNTLCARIDLRSEFGVRGLKLFDGFQIPPGYSGRPEMRMMPIAWPVKLTLGTKMFTIEFSRLDTPSKIDTVTQP